MRRNIEDDTMPKAKKQGDPNKIHSGLNFAVILGASGGVSFGILGLFMICVGYFSSGTEASIINQAAVKFIFIAVPALLIGLYGLLKLEKSGNLRQRQ